MISWIPLLGKEGLINSALDQGRCHRPAAGRGCCSPIFSVVVAYVHLLTLFMIVPIFNSMARIDKRCSRRRVDAGAVAGARSSASSCCRSARPALRLASIFVVSLVMGDFFVVKVMCGGGSASVVGAFYEDIGVLQYPTAAASATILTVIVLLLVVAILRTVDIRKELTR